MDLDVDHIRKVATLERGRRAFEGELIPTSVYLDVTLDKVASADPDLLMIAEWFGQDVLETYEALGGRYGGVR